MKNKTVIIPDLHGRSDWKLIIYQENPDEVVFLGDYFDSYDISGVEQLHNFKEIINYKETAFTNEGKEDQHATKVVMLIGNHDHHYFSFVGDGGTSKYQSGIAPNIAQVLEDNIHHLQMSYEMGEFLFTHAGVSEVFMDQVFGSEGWEVDNVADDLNELWKHKPKEFCFNGYRSDTGDEVMQTPIWIRPSSLMRAGKMKREMYKKYIQVVGHTPMKKIDREGKSTGGRYYFVDTLPTSGEYMIITDGIISFGSIKSIK